MNIEMIKKRWNAPTSNFFKPVMKIGIGVAGIGTAILTLTAIPNIVLPTWVVPISSHLILAGTIASAIARLTVQDTNDLTKTEETTT